MKKKRTFPSPVVDGYEHAPSHAMLRAVSFTDKGFGKPPVGIASIWQKSHLNNVQSWSL